MALSIAAITVACGSTQQAAETVRSSWTGKPADEFFVKHGPPKRTHTLANGGKVYLWETVAMPSGTSKQIACTADIVTDPKGLITSIKLQEDTIGHWNLSRCSEVFHSRLPQFPALECLAHTLRPHRSFSVE